MRLNTSLGRSNSRSLTKILALRRHRPVGADCTGRCARPVRHLKCAVLQLNQRRYGVYTLFDCGAVRHPPADSGGVYLHFRLLPQPGRDHRYIDDEGQHPRYRGFYGQTHRSLQRCEHLHGRHESDRKFADGGGPLLCGCPIHTTRCCGRGNSVKYNPDERLNRYDNDTPDPDNASIGHALCLTAEH